MTPLLEAAFSAGYGSRRVLDDVRFTIAPGELLGLAGMSGNGKSTLVLAVLGLLPHRGGFVEGTIQFDGRDMLSLSARRLRPLLGRDIALVPQNPHSALNPRLSIKGHFAEAWRAHRPGEKALGREAASAALESVELFATLLNRRPGEISTGQAQRVLIALALLHQPRLLIADEPTSALDMLTQASLLRLLTRINQERGTSILFVSHDLLSTASLCHRLAILSGGRIVECLPTERLGLDAAHPATIALLQAIPALPAGLPAR